MDTEPKKPIPDRTQKLARILFITGIALLLLGLGFLAAGMFYYEAMTDEQVRATIWGYESVALAGMVIIGLVGWTIWQKVRRWRT